MVMRTRKNNYRSHANLKKIFFCNIMIECQERFLIHMSKSICNYFLLRKWLHNTIIEPYLPAYLLDELIRHAIFRWGTVWTAFHPKISNHIRTIVFVMLKVSTIPETHNRNIILITFCGLELKGNKLNLQNRIVGTIRSQII